MQNIAKNMNEDFTQLVQWNNYIGRIEGQQMLEIFQWWSAIYIALTYPARLQTKHFLMVLVIVVYLSDLTLRRLC